MHYVETSILNLKFCRFLVLFIAEAHFYMGTAAFLAAAERFRGTVVEPAGNGAATGIHGVTASARIKPLALTLNIKP